ncbi:HAD family hydrolase [Algicola sagamiensis]|uniref:HAD family hydrolase n=1 Tax=Algicola sagamiensis TaxID=163869 RepID=UPI000365B217|nr:HAD-IA family hydrolase [Algicola sagamiensis]
MYQAVLFDLDGTLLDTADDLGAALNHTLAHYGLEHIPAEFYRPEASNGSLGLLKLGLKHRIDDFNFEELKSVFFDYYQSNIAHFTQFFEGIQDILQWLDEQSIDWGVVTNKPGFLTEQLLHCFPAFSRAKVVLSGDSLSKRKPDPMPLLHAAEVMGVQPEHCIYVGDALRDIEAGNRAGMKTIIAGYGYIEENALLDSWNADKTTSSVTELNTLLQQMFVK